MSGDRLVVDKDFLIRLAEDLGAVAREFEQANAGSDQAASAVGHPQLADHVRDFAHNWDDRRQKMLNNIQTLATSAAKVAEGFTQVDTQLGHAVEARR